MYSSEEQMLNKTVERKLPSERSQIEDPIQDHFMITKLGFWSIAQILLDFTAAIHILGTFWFLALKGQQRIQHVLLKPPSFHSARKPTHAHFLPAPLMKHTEFN